MYAGFAAQVAVAVIADFAGAITLNLQLRILPGLMVFAVVLFVQALERIWLALHDQERSLSSRRRAALGRQTNRHIAGRERGERSKNETGRGHVSARTAARRTESGKVHLLDLVRRLATPGFALLIAWFAMASLLKASTDPVVSHRWTFYSNAEQSALQWLDDSLTYKQTVWVGLDNRLSTLYYAHAILSDNVYNAEIYGVSAMAPWVRYIVFSDTERLRYTRLEKAFPAVGYELQIYDNGETQVYRRRPRTPYQW
jgi:hypothetical protein